MGQQYNVQLGCHPKNTLYYYTISTMNTISSNLSFLKTIGKTLKDSLEKLVYWIGYSN